MKLRYSSLNILMRIYLQITMNIRLSFAAGKSYWDASCKNLQWFRAFLKIIDFFVVFSRSTEIKCNSFNQHHSISPHGVSLRPRRLFYKNEYLDRGSFTHLPTVDCQTSPIWNGRPQANPLGQAASRVVRELFGTSPIGAKETVAGDRRGARLPSLSLPRPLDESQEAVPEIPREEGAEQRYHQHLQVRGRAVLLGPPLGTGPPDDQ